MYRCSTCHRTSTYSSQYTHSLTTHARTYTKQSVHCGWNRATTTEWAVAGKRNVDIVSFCGRGRHRWANRMCLSADCAYDCHFFFVFFKFGFDEPTKFLRIIETVHCPCGPNARVLNADNECPMNDQTVKEHTNRQRNRKHWMWSYRKERLGYQARPYL